MLDELDDSFLDHKSKFLSRKDPILKGLSSSQYGGSGFACSETSVTTCRSRLGYEVKCKFIFFFRRNWHHEL